MDNLRKLIRKVNQKYLGPLIARLEKKVMPARLASDPTPIWIIGSPRSGSTLLYNTLVNTFEFTYISNFVAKFPYTTYAAAYVEQFLPFKKNYSYRFQLGDTKQWAAPHESWNFLYRWFPRGYQNVYVPADALSEKDIADFRRNVQALIEVGNGPFILKNTLNSMRIAILNRVFPRSLFIVCQRNYLDIAQSLFRARKASGNVHKWLGAAPKEYEQIKSLEVHEQIVKQVQYIYRQIEQDKNALDLENRMIYVNYKDFCTGTIRDMHKIVGFIKSHGLLLNQIKEIPSQFSYHSEQRIPDEDYALFKKLIDT